MSSRSRDLISATLISAGIVAAGELHLACNTGTAGTAFRDYWTDWFDNDRWHETVSSGEAAMTAGRNDVLLVGLGTNNVTGTLTWNLANTHMVGAGAIQKGRPQARLQLAGTGAVSPMISVAATGCTFANLTMRHGRDTGANASCFCCLQVSSGAGDFVGRNLFIWGPEDDTLNDSTGYKLVKLYDHAEFYNCLLGYGYPISGTCSSDSACLVWFAKSVFNSSEWYSCTFQMETSKTTNLFLMLEGNPAGGTYHTFNNCNFVNVSTTSITFGIGSNAGAGSIIWGNEAGKLMLNNSYFAGCTDVSHASNESRIVTGPQVTTGKNVLGGLAGGFDHTE